MSEELLFSSGSEGFQRDLFIGVGTFAIKAVCPDEKELKELFGENAEAIEYVKKTDDGRAAASPVLILELLNSPKQTEKPVYVREYLYIKDMGMTNRDKDKIQVINEYGDTAWVTKEEFTANTPPSYQPEFIMPYRPAFVGEEGHFIL